MVRRGTIVAVVVLRLAGTRAYPRIAPAPVITAPTFALAAETDRRDPRLPAPAARGEVTPAPRVLLRAAPASQRAPGVVPKFFRFPGGCYDRRALDLVHAAGLIPVQWSVNSIDAFNTYPQQIVSTVLSGVQPGSIVVMHLHGRANAPSTGTALRLLIPELEKRGYQFVTVSELLAAGTPIQPVDPREVSEFYQPPSPRWCCWLKV